MEGDLLNNNHTGIEDEHQKDITKYSETVYETGVASNSDPNSPGHEGFKSTDNPENPISASGEISPSPGSHTGFGQFDSPNNHVVSEKVQNLASQIYTELQRVISRFNDDDEVVSGLMPLIVNVLESLDLQMIETQQLAVELELLKDDNDQLMLAFEKEKGVKKKLEQQLFEYEFQSDEEKQKLQQKIASLENIVKMLELKSKNSNDNVGRLEDEKSELKTEFAKLHNRNTELLRSYCDLMERVKILIGGDEQAGQSLINYAQLDPNNLSKLKKTNAELIENIEKTKEIRREAEQARKADDRLSESMELHTQQSNKSNYNNLNELMSMEDNQSMLDLPLDDLPREPQSLSGMEKEVENLIKENNELLATKNALNIVKDDLIAQVDELQSQLAFCKEENLQLLKIQEMYRSKLDKCEEELRKNMQQIEEYKAQLSQKNEDSEEGVSLSQRKRFTRVEMARVLMERNQYKEKLMELQEAIKWTEFVRQSNKNGAQEKRSAIWKFFSNLFSNTSAPSSVATVPVSGNTLSSIKYTNAASTSAADVTASSTSTPALESMRRRAKYYQTSSTLGLNSMSNPVSTKEELMLYLDNDLSCELKKMNRSQARGNQNIIAYGWCLQPQQSNASDSIPDPTTPRRMPVPIYCRPLASSAPTASSVNTTSNGLKIWCAAAVDLNGGETGSSYRSLDQGRTPDELIGENRLSTFTWICSASHSKSKITIVNMKSNPSEILDNFYVKTHLLCICSVPGTESTDLPPIILDQIGEGTAIKLVRKTNNTPSNRKSDDSQSGNILQTEDSFESLQQEDSTKNLSTLEKLNNFMENYEGPSSITSVSSNRKSEKPNEQRANLRERMSDNTDRGSKFYEKMSTVLSTMWLGGQNGRVYIHSSVAQWAQLIHYVDLSDSVLGIYHCTGRVLVALGNGELCIFSRFIDTREWNLNEYCVINLNSVARLFYSGNLVQYSNTGFDLNTACAEKEQTTAEIAEEALEERPDSGSSYAIRCCTVAGSNVWCGYRNLLITFDISDMRLLNCTSVHSSREQQVRQLAVFQYAHAKSADTNFILSILRLDCVLRIYENRAPFANVLNIDLEPTINKFLMGNFSSTFGAQLTSGSMQAMDESSTASSGENLISKLGGLINFIRITSLKLTESRIWLGTANGVILTVPHTLEIESPGSSGKCLPKLQLNNCQLSFHGHKDSVRFFVAAKNFVLSGGEGYTDFRLESEMDSGLVNSLSRADQSHLILWEINLC